jgi:ATP-dependent Zn protease
LISPTGKTAQQKEVTFNEALNLIRSKQIKEIVVRQDELTLEDKAKIKYYTKLDSSDGTRDKIYNAAKNTDTKISLEPASSGIFWIMLINLLPFFLMWAITLMVIVYAVNALSRNKS